MTKTHSTEDFLLNASPLDIVALFWQFKSEIEHNKTIMQRINEKNNGKIAITDEELRQIALKLKRIAKEDNEMILRRKARRQ